jgi:hypothetical protein
MSREWRTKPSQLREIQHGTKALREWRYSFWGVAKDMGLKEGGVNGESWDAIYGEGYGRLTCVTLRL